MRDLLQVHGKMCLFLGKTVYSILPQSTQLINGYLALIRQCLEELERVRYMLPAALEYPPGDCNGFRVYRPDKGKGKGIRFIVLYPPKCSHDLPPLAGTVHTETISIPRGIFQSNWQHIAHTL